MRSVLQVLLGMWLVFGRFIAGFVLLFGLAGTAFQTFNLILRETSGRTIEPWPGAEISFYRLGASVVLMVAALVALRLTPKVQ